MKTQKLGHTGVEVSSLCLGAMYFGTRNDQATSYRLLDQYVDAGGSFIDTANIYSFWVDGYKGGESEILIGEWMRERGNRNQVFIASKVGFGYQDVPKRLRASDIE
ncbi:MAG TPA: aldo/keto reductase, partial [Phototrophicaceae bacterium]|nr:aldo/keto reductase [Phototrophicaceae bacterium]